jgi:arylsulfotransferase ASST
VADTAFAVAFDPAGAIRWYRGFPTQPGEHALACEQQPDGNFTLFVGASSGWQPVSGRYYEFTPAGDSVATYTAAGAYYTDPHEVLVRGVGGRAADTAIYLIGYDLRSFDLTSLGGGPTQVIAGHSILRQSADGSVNFQWSAWDHFTLDDWVARPSNLSQTSQLDFDHANSIELDPRGDYVVSFAAVTQVVKIDHATGALRWRFGGRLNQFTLVGDPLGGFGIQHDVRLLSNGDLLLFDNGNFHTPPESRAVEYRLDMLAMTATLVWQSRHAPPLYAPFVGSVQRFQNGHTMIGYGAADLTTEVSEDGTVIWEGRLDVAGQALTVFYRVRGLPSLYVHQQP